MSIRLRWNMERYALFSEQMAHLLKNGIPLLNAIMILGEQRIVPPSFSHHVSSLLQHGYSLSETLHAEKFPSMFLSFMRVAEEHGNYQLGFEQCTRYYEARSRWMKELTKAITYPLFLLLFVIIALFFLFIILLPRFHELYQVMGIPLPPSTQLIFQLQSYMVYILWGMLITLLIGLLSWLSREWIPVQMRHNWGRLMSKMPFVRVIYRYRISHFFALQLGSMLKAGVPLLKAIVVIREGAPWQRLSDHLKWIEQGLLKGRSFHSLVQTYEKDIFIHALPTMVAIGEQSGSLAEILLTFAKQTEQLMKSLMDKMIKISEPLFILLIGVGIAFMIISLFLPMLQLVQAI
ncbi:type II secretion system F family protein [Hazenella sp. IB182357]|uniref:Type II secretion system F family protein n=1 Tax=Polycladospora coralii TaxID=2771432 RepID=A0A926N978_9BACL|nr:type II secretion system F family protein [Polycladospora coralii]MBD1371215.1 type II secretion system F family protein [Polycladospora coralii]